MPRRHCKTCGNPRGFVRQPVWTSCGGLAENFTEAQKSSQLRHFLPKRTTKGSAFRSMLFPPVTLLPQVLRRVRKQRLKLILIAPLWRNQPWVSELFQLLKAALWPIPLRRDLLSQANVTIWHPWPELWALHVWPLDGSLSSSQSVS